MLLGEAAGSLVRENTHKPVGSSNQWQFELAMDQSEADPTDKRKMVTAGQISVFLKQHLWSDASPTLNFASMVHTLRTIDNNRHQRISLDEFVWALNELSFPTLAESEYKAFFNLFDRQNEGKIDWNDLVNSLRETLEGERLDAVRKAYAKMDATGKQGVTLDDIALVYDVRGSRDCASGYQTQDQHYKTFMALWGLIYRDAKVSFNQFVEYYTNVSPAYETDSAFVEMMTACWGL